MKKYNFFLDGIRYQSGLYPDNDLKLIQEVMKFFESKGKKVLPDKAKVNKNSTTLYFITSK